MLHEAENEAEAKTYEAEATKFGLEAVLASRTYNIPGMNVSVKGHLSHTSFIPHNIKLIIFLKCISRTHKNRFQ